MEKITHLHHFPMKKRKLGYPNRERKKESYMDKQEFLLHSFTLHELWILGYHACVLY